jgi:hypothetical protein
MSWPFPFLSFHLETAVDTYFQYLRTYSQELGSRIVEMYPPVQGPNDPIAKRTIRPHKFISRSRSSSCRLVDTGTFPVTDILWNLDLCRASSFLSVTASDT